MKYEEYQGNSKTGFLSDMSNKILTGDPRSPDYLESISEIF